ncbi:TonB-dependent receptor plug domain-containing protein [Nguyenibacter sp. L1]|uniref:TonB-dependent receptor n=1 Tax=Nguyenibacter sp. L1 TaxID=3049350 RepID=UPI002B4853B2|nr:TonB-dependent receptor plug domain-containing protein [Nguyenibacter sp. L1]WRH87120.1 TonB-dependent receptor plug domain-containing protein [Nguyenibacter sp. L1]
MSVTARAHEARNTENVVSRAAIEQLAPGTNVLKAVGQLPGVSFSSSDPLGIDTWGASVYMRGFFQNQLGVTLDGIPLNDQGYGNVNGLNVANAVITADIANVSVSQGGGALDVPSNTNLGGAMQFSTADPKHKAGAIIEQGFGSYGMEHTYIRLDSGDLNHTGTRAFGSYSRNYEEKYDSPSSGILQQADGKLVQPLGADSIMSAFFNWSEAQVWVHADKSFDILNKLGWRVEDLYPNYAAAYAAANWVAYCGGLAPSCATPPGVLGGAGLPAGWFNTNAQAGVAFYDGGQTSIDYLGGLNFDIAINDRLRWKATIYGHSDTQYQTYGDPYQPSATGAPLSEEVWQPRQERYGFQTSLHYFVGRHAISTGVWFENNNQQFALFWYNEPLLGHGAPLKTIGPYDVYGRAFLQDVGYQWNTNSFQYYAMDVWRPLRNISVTYGFKSLVQTTSGGADYNNPEFNYGPLANGSMTAAGGFLPHVNLDWHFAQGHELYFDMAENMRPYSVSGAASLGAVGSPWNVAVPAPTNGQMPPQTSQDLFKTLQRTLHPERDWDFVLGYRYTGKLISVTADAYHADLYHHLISASLGTLNAPVTTVLDTHHADMWGADAAATLRPLPRLAITNTFSYNRFTYDTPVNLCTGGMVCNLQGKRLSGYPAFMYKADASYSWGRLLVHFGANYYSARPFSLMNDTSVPAYWLSDLGARYLLGNYGMMKNLTVSFNVYNTFNAKYIAMMGENGFPVSGDAQSMERGAVRQFFGTARAEF